MNNNMEKQEQDFDFSRNDKLFALTIPTYKFYGDVVLYDVHLKDLVHNKQYIHSFRFKQLKQYHQSLIPLKIELPQFPKTHFWKKTNKDPDLIQQRRQKLQNYFAIVLNDPFTRGNVSVKKFIRICKVGRNILNRPNSANTKIIPEITKRPKSISPRLKLTKTTIFTRVTHKK